MNISRLDLDGVGSPAAIAARILEVEPDLALAIPLESLCGSLDIASITQVDTNGFEAALVMDVNKAAGAILLASNRARQRRRYSIAHELGHFLIPTHRPDAANGFECQLDDLHRVNVAEQNRRRRIEAEANRFAAALLMPTARVRSRMGPAPDLADIIRLARDFDVSKEALARTYVEASREAIAILILQRGRILRIYKSQDFRWIALSIGQTVPVNSIASEIRQPQSLSDPDECDPDIWLTERDSRRTELLLEQVLGQAAGFAMVLLHAELAEDDDE